MQYFPPQNQKKKKEKTWFQVKTWGPWFYHTCGYRAFFLHPVMHIEYERNNVKFNKGSATKSVSQYN